MKARRILIYLSLAVMAIACVKEPTALNVNPKEATIPAAGGSVYIAVRCDGDWNLSVPESDRWCRTSQSAGSGNSTISIIADSNLGGNPRSTEILFSAGSLTPVSVSISQEGKGGTPVEGVVSPEPSSGLTLEPSLPDADKPCTIIFKPGSGNPLYNHTGELYGHLGVVIEGEWAYVPCEWATTGEKTHFKKVGDNHWELKLEPSIREYFGSGETPVNMIAVIVRNAAGTIKNHPADQFNTVTDNRYAPESFTPDPVVKEAMPAGIKYGMNFHSDNSVTFALYDRDKDGNCHDYCYITGDWNNWERVSEGAMKRDDKSGCWWTTLSGFDPDKEYRFQYRLGNGSSDLRLSDPYTEIVYDQWNDQYIPWAPLFPEKARGLVSAFKINRTSYEWAVPKYTVEDRNDLIIYELLLRDFTEKGNLEGALEHLDYLVELGVNAIELMPVQEFDGNDSWGYNPNHWFALDKAYGRRDEYKHFIDECHKRGMAVILDVVYNHATGNHTWAKMWWDKAANSTAANNPWFNKVPTHPFNVFHDINHENTMVRETIKQSLAYLLTEYKFDGFRFDMSKGFTQTMTDPDVGKWGKYDQSRVDILTDYSEYIRSVNPDAVIIFEHLSDWDEEKTLAEKGIQLWRNINGEYRKAMAGNAGSFTNLFSTSPFGAFVGYMESHDEERLCAGIGKTGEALKKAMDRAALCAAFFLTVPGPKMIWQFGEIGYDYSINYNERTGRKPVVTESYLKEPQRKALYDTYAALIKFRRDNPRFFDKDAKFSWTPGAAVKSINCSVDGKSFHIVGNFGKTDVSYTIPEGNWKDWRSGKAESGEITLKSSEFRLFTDL